MNFPSAFLDSDGQHDQNRTRLYGLYNAMGAWRALQEHLGIPNVSIVYNYVIHGITPGNREHQKALGIENKKLDATRAKYKAWNEAHQKKGWNGYHEYLEYSKKRPDIIPQCPIRYD